MFSALIWNFVCSALSEVTSPNRVNPVSFTVVGLQCTLQYSWQYTRYVKVIPRWHPLHAECRSPTWWHWSTLLIFPAHKKHVVDKIEIITLLVTHTGNSLTYDHEHLKNSTNEAFLTRRFCEWRRRVKRWQIVITLPFFVVETTNRWSRNWLNALSYSSQGWWYACSNS